MDMDARDQFYRALYKIVPVFDCGAQEHGHECLLRLSTVSRLASVNMAI
jgi:hypothetical protein